MKHPLYSENHNKHYIYKIPVMSETEYKQHIANTNNISEFTRKQINQHLETEKRSEEYWNNVIKW